MIDIRPMVYSDVSPVMALLERCALRGMTGERLHAWVADECVVALVAGLEGVALAGWIIGRTVVDELEIFDLAVDPACRRRGIAGLLVGDAVDEARERGAIRAFLEVRASNPAAIALYEKQRFKQAGIRKKYYQDSGEDAVVMARELYNGTP